MIKLLQFLGFRINIVVVDHLSKIENLTLRYRIDKIKKCKV